MKVIILCAGYGTRLQQDISIQLCSGSTEFQHLEGVPKPLLPIQGLPLVSHWLSEISVAGVDVWEDVYVICNDQNIGQFKTWIHQENNSTRSQFNPLHLMSDGTKANESRIGAVAAIQTTIAYFGLHGKDFLVIGGDTLFYKDFQLGSFLEAFQALKQKKISASLVTCYEEVKERISKTGILQVDEAGKIINFLEKPNQDTSPSNLACPCFYCFDSGVLTFLEKFLLEKKNASLEEKDATGKFLQYLYSKLPIYTFPISGRFDVGGLDSYVKANSLYGKL